MWEPKQVFEYKNKNLKTIKQIFKSCKKPWFQKNHGSVIVFSEFDEKSPPVISDATFTKFVQRGILK